MIERQSLHRNEFTSLSTNRLNIQILKGIAKP